MGLIALLRRWLFGDTPAPTPTPGSDGPGATPSSNSQRPPATSTSAPRPSSGAASTGPSPPREIRVPRAQRPPRRRRTEADREAVARLPYAFAAPQGRRGFLDLSTDGDPEHLGQHGLPVLSTPADIAAWLGMPIGRLAWLAGRFHPNRRPQTAQDAHYHFRWTPKRSGGARLIEAPKPLLKSVQTRILREVLDRIPAHQQAHGFVAERSALTNAEPHVGQYVVVKLDLENFYPAVRYSRIVAIFRSLGYSREAAIWLSRLCTSAAPATLPFGPTGPHDLLPYLPRHLPQGAPTSPALANLSTFVLDLRLSGLARAYGAVYTRYADDLTFSGSHRFAGALRDFLQISARIISQERFRVNRKKRKVLRRTSRQVVTGVVVNDRLNVDRREYDRLRAILHNCRKTGPSLQNHDSREDFRAHLRGRIAYVAAIHPARGARLLTIFNQIAWTEPR